MAYKNKIIGFGNHYITALMQLPTALVLSKILTLGFGFN